MSYLQVQHQPGFVSVHSQDSEFPTSYFVVFFFTYNDKRRDVIVHFVDIGGIVLPSLFKLSFHKLIKFSRTIFKMNVIIPVLSK